MIENRDVRDLYGDCDKDEPHNRITDRYAEELFNLTYAEKPDGVSYLDWMSYKQRVRWAAGTLWRAGQLLGESKDPVVYNYSANGLLISVAIFSILMFISGLIIGFYL